MQAQDAATAYFFKAWEWAENNLKLVVIGTVIVIFAAALISYRFWRQNEAEVAAAEALSQLVVSTPPDYDSSQIAGAYLKIAADYPGTQAAGRALTIGAATLYVNGKYAEAQTTFQKYLRAHPTGAFAATAALGLAASLNAQGITNAAVNAYQRVINSYSDPNAVDSAKFALAQLDEQRGNLTEAEKFYQDVARNNANSPLGSEAALHASQLRSKTLATQTSSNPPSPLTQTSSNPPAPFHPNTEP